MTESDRIVSDPEIMGGVPVVRGTRVPVYVVLEGLEAGQTCEDLLREYPALTTEDVQASIRHAARRRGVP